MMMITSDPTIARKMACARKQRSQAFYQAFNWISFTARPAQVWSFLKVTGKQMVQAYRGVVLTAGPKPCDTC